MVQGKDADPVVDENTDETLKPDESSGENPDLLNKEGSESLHVVEIKDAPIPSIGTTVILLPS